MSRVPRALQPRGRSLGCPPWRGFGGVPQNSCSVLPPAASKEQGSKGCKPLGGGLGVSPKTSILSCPLRQARRKVWPLKEKRIASSLRSPAILASSATTAPQRIKRTTQSLLN